MKGEGKEKEDPLLLQISTCA